MTTTEKMCIGAGSKSSARVRESMRIAFGALLAMASFAAAADCSVDMCSNVSIEQIYVESGSSGNSTWIRTSGTETNLSMCSPDSSVYLWLDGNVSQKKEMLSLLMMAYALDKPVSIRVYNGSRGCAIAYAFLNR
jgi:hypothetical protein